MIDEQIISYFGLFSFVVVLPGEKTHDENNNDKEIKNKRREMYFSF